MRVDCELNGGGGDESSRARFDGRGLWSAMVVVVDELVDNSPTGNE